MTFRCQLYIVSFALPLLTIGCGGSAPASNAPPAATAAPVAAPAVEVHDGRAVEITANDQMKFDVNEIRAKAGERLSVTLINNGTMPKFSMGHNWVLLAADVSADTFASAAVEAPTTDYMPASRKGDVLAATKLLGPAERATVTFAAPTTPGRYSFLCSFPGHYQIGMRGVLIVE
jgi:azurin